MVSLAKEVMDNAYQQSRKALDEDNFERHFGFQAFESMVNNIQHGKSPTEWISQIANIYSNLDGFSEEEAKAITEMLTYTYDLASHYGIPVPSQFENDD